MGEICMAGRNAGLMKIKKFVLGATKAIIQPQPVTYGQPVTLVPQTFYKFAIIIFHGDGDPGIVIDVKVGDKTYTLSGDEQAIELVVGQNVTITASNPTPDTIANSMTIEMAYLTW
jgi:hypothetical protein